MTDKEFKRLSRSELIEIIYEYQKQEQQLKAQVEQMQERLFQLEEIASLTEAVSSLKETLEQTNASALAYEQRSKETYERTQKECRKLLERAHARAEKIMKDSSKGERTR